MEARVRADFQVWTVGHPHPATNLNVLSDTPPKYDELFPVKIAAAADREEKESGLGDQHI